MSRNSGREQNGQRAAVDDREIMAALAAGKPEALEELYRQYGRMMVSVMVRYAPGLSDEDIEDLSQEVLLAVYHRAPRYQHRDKLRSWLCALAIGKARDWRRKKMVTTLLAGRLRDVRQVERRGTDPGLRSDARMQLERALARLPAGQREVLMLHEVNGLTGEEIAEVVGIRPKTVWTRLHRARQSLRRMLARDAGVNR